MAGGAHCKNAADQHADRAHGQLAGQRRAGDGERRVVQRAEPHDQVVVEPAAAERQQDEEHHVGEDRGREQQPPAVKRCAGLVAARLGGRLYRLRRLALPDQDQRGKKPDRRGREVGAAPANDAVQEQQRRRGRRIAHHAGEGVEGKHAAGALGRHVLRKQRVVGRVVDRVGEAEHAEHGDEHPERIDQPRHRDGACANDKPADQPQPRARAVDQKTHGRLQHGRGDVEGGERKPKLGIAHAIFLAHEQEQGREQHDVEMAGKMRKAHAADEAFLGTARNREREFDGLGHMEFASACAARMACHTRCGVAGMSM